MKKSPYRRYHSTGWHLGVVTIGAQNLEVVKTKEVVMAAHKDRVQDVKKVVEHLRALR